jgi:peptidoglycan/LPS O-acetylase OafA/YrhL
MSRVSSTHVPVLDGIRGLAILLVVMIHLTQFGGLQYESVAGEALKQITRTGWTGVDLFFVLSGFLITGILYDAKGGHSFFAHFYARRCLRIFPVYYGVLFLLFVMLPLVRQPSASFQALIDDQAWYWAYLANVKIALTDWPEHVSLGHFWSLAVEEQFYLVWPLVVYFLGHRALIRVCIGCILAALGVRLALAWFGLGLPAYVLAPARMDALAVGGLLALVARGTDGLSPWRHHAWWALASSLAVLAAILLWRRELVPEDAVMFTGGFSLLAVFFGALLTLTVTSPPGSALATLFSSSALTLMGRYSYGLYVFHVPLFGLLRRRGITISSFEAVLGSHAAGHIAYVLGAGGAALLMAMVSWHLFESQILKWKSKFPYRPAADPLRFGQIT